MRRGLAPKGVLIATFVENHGEPGGTGMLHPGGGGGLYPKCVRYTWPEVADLIDAEGSSVPTSGAMIATDSNGS